MLRQTSPLTVVFEDDDRLSPEDEFDRFGPWEDDEYDRTLYA